MEYNLSLDKRYYEGIVNNFKWYFTFWYSRVKPENRKWMLINNCLTLVMIILLLIIIVMGTKIEHN